MLGLVNTLSDLGTTAPQPIDGILQLKASTKYLIQTDCITKMKVLGTTDSDLRYKLNPKEDKSPEFILRVNETNAQVTAIADTAAASNMIALDVFLNEYGEDVLTFAEAELSTTSTTTKYYNIEDICWGEQNADENKSMLLINEGGWDTRKIFVDSDLDKIEDLAETGTTTTTTSSTSTTSAA